MARMERTIRKAVFPAAGLGTRFLPATKVLPKEMLVLVDKPVIQYGVEEAVQSGVPEIVIVTSRGKSSMEDHFDVAFELEAVLERRGKTEQLAEVRQMMGIGHVSYVRQSEPLGLGHAVLVAKHLVGDEPFAVILSDDVIDAKPPALKQLVDVYERVRGPVIAVETCRTRTSRSTGSSPSMRASISGRMYSESRTLWRNQHSHEAPSNLAIIGRYVLTPDIFPALEATASDRTGEIQLTNGLRQLLRDRPLYACKVSGVRHDTGNKVGFLKASVYFALQRPELAEPLRAYLETLGGEAGAGRVRSPMTLWRARFAPALSAFAADASVDPLSGLRLGLRRLVLGRGRGLGAGLALGRVVRDVPASALELNRRRRHQTADWALPAQRARTRDSIPRTSGSPRTVSRRRRTRTRRAA